MKALLKYSLMTLLLLILLLVAALVIIPTLVNPNDYKPELEKLVHKHTGMEMKIAGEIDLSLFPWLGFEVAGVTLNNRQQPLAELARARAGLKLLPLLGGNIEMQALELDGLDLRLHKDARGNTNWALNTTSQQATSGANDSPTRAEEQAETTATEDGSSSTDSQPLAIRFNIAEVQIHNISVHYLDQQQGNEYQLNDMNLVTGAIEAGQPFDLQLEFNASSKAPQLSLNSRLSTRASLDLEQQSYQFAQFKLDSQIQGEGTNGKTLQLSLQADVDADLGNDRVRLDNLVVQLANLQLNADLQLNSLQQPAYQGQLQIPAFDLNALLTALGQDPITTSNPEALKAIGFSGQLKGTDQQASIDQLKLVIDSSHFDGQLQIADFSRQALRFTLNGDRFNVDDYLPPDNDQDSSATTGNTDKSSDNNTQATGNEWDDSPLLPIESLKSLDLIGELGLQELITNGVAISEATLKFSAQQAVLKLQQLSGTAFDGQFNKSATLNLNKSPIAINAAVTMSDVDITEVLTLATPDNPAARGRANISSKITARGNSLRKIINSLNGNTGFHIDDGALLDTNLNRMVCSAVAKVRKKSLADEPRINETPFNRLQGNFIIRNGIAANEDLTASMDNLKLSGDGEINLPDRQLDYHLGLTIIGNTADQDEACQINERYADIAWPVRCKGSFNDTKSLCRLDNERLSKIIASQAGKELQEKLNKKLEKKFGTGLKGLFDKFK